MRRWLPLLLALCLSGMAVVALPAPAESDSSCAAAPRDPDPNDPDCDGVVVGVDNCPTVRNNDQVNTDQGWTPTTPAPADGSSKTMAAGDDRGDACESVDADNDTDADGIKDDVDNCRFVRNPDQRADARETICKPVDDDADGTPDERDNCRGLANPDQADLDGDRRGDACDADDDADAVLDEQDNCPTVANSEQGDRDGDGVGTACDPGEIADTAVATPTPDPRTANDRTAPAVRLSVSRRQSVADVAGGMPVSVRCSEACGLEATIVLARRDARRLRLRSTVLARAEASLGATGRTFLIFRAVRGWSRRLPARGVGARLRLSAVDGAQNRSSVERRLRFVR